MREVMLWTSVSLALLGFALPLQAQDSDLESLVGKYVFIKDHVHEAMAKSKDSPGRYLDSYEEVFETKDGKVRVGRIWLQRDDVMTLEEATAYYEEEVRRDPKLPLAWRGAAICRLMRKSSKEEVDANYEASMKAIQEAIRLDPDDAESMRWRACVFYYMKEYEKAKWSYEESLRLRPDSPATLCDLAWIKYRLGDAAGAKAAAHKAVQLDLQSANSLYRRASLRFYLNEDTAAIDDLTRALRLDSSRIDVLRLRGMAYLKLKDYDKSLADFGEIVRLRPNRAEGYKFRAMLRSSKEDIDGMLSDLDKAIELDPTADSYQMRGGIRFAKQNIEGAIEECEEAIRLDPRSKDAYKCLSLLYFSKQNFEKVVECIDGALPLESSKQQQRNMLLSRGYAKHCLNDIIGARQDYRSATKLFPKQVDSYHHGAMLLATSSNPHFRDLAKAEQLLATIQVLEPNNPDTRAVEACALALKGDFSAAVDLQKKSLEDKDFAENEMPILGAADAKARIAAWEKGELWTYKKR